MSGSVTGTASRYLCFSLGQEEYAIPLSSVREVIAVPDITPVPYTPGYFLGIMNLRGQIISIMDLRGKLGIKSEEKREQAVIICDIHPLCMGIVVDSVNYVLSLSENEILEKPEIESQKSTDYIQGVYRRDKSLVLLIDVAKTLDVEDYTSIKAATKAA